MFEIFGLDTSDHLKMSFPNCERWGSVLFTLVYKRGFEKAIYQLELGLFWLS